MIPPPSRNLLKRDGSEFNLQHFLLRIILGGWTGLFMPWVQCCHISILSFELLNHWIESLCNLLFHAHQALPEL